MNQVLVWLFLGFTCTAVVRIRTERTGRSDASARRRPPSRFIRLLNREGRLPELLPLRPVEWLESRRSANRFFLWIWPLLGFCLFVLAEVDPLGSSRAKLGFLLLALIQTVVKIWLAAHATYAFAADRRSGALESLLGTRLEVREIAAGMRRGFGRRFGRTLGVLCLLDLLCAIQLFGEGAEASALILVLAAAMMLADCYCLFWVGLLKGLVAPSPALALGAAMLRILVLPWAWFLILAQIYWRSSIFEFLILWMIVIPLNHVVFLMNARASFFRYFRTLALKPFAEKNPHMESDWSPINWEDETLHGLGHSGRESAHSSSP